MKFQKFHLLTGQTSQSNLYLIPLRIVIVPTTAAVMSCRHTTFVIVSVRLKEQSPLPADESTVYIIGSIGGFQAVHG